MQKGDGIMNKIIVLLLFPVLSWSNCDWKNIEEKEGKYIYSEECHVKVGKTVKKAERQEKIITLQDLTINKYDERLELWINHSDKLEKRVTDMERFKELHSTLYFIGGVLFTSLAVYSAGQLR